MLSRGGRQSCGVFVPAIGAALAAVLPWLRPWRVARPVRALLRGPGVCRLACCLCAYLASRGPPGRGPICLPALCCPARPLSVLPAA
ncbi:unnamed protein product [Amoebophrya sp. A120]|nr:unnamed protein product [Amoebophrya sp. A120]|eukprot:GSA120T00015904001.1